MKVDGGKLVELECRITGMFLSSFLELTLIGAERESVSQKLG